MWREIKGKPYMLTMETGKLDLNTGVNTSAVAYVMAIQVTDGVGGFREVFRGGFFAGTSSSPFQFAMRKNNVNFRSFHEVCKHIERILKVRNENQEPQEDLAKLLTEV